MVAVVILCILAVPGTKMLIEKTVEISVGVAKAYKTASKKLELDPDED